MPSRKQVIAFNGVKSFCLDRSLTHVLLSWDSWNRYNACVTSEWRKKGIQSCICHQTVLMPTRWMPNDAMLGMNARSKGAIAKPIGQIISAYFEECEKDAESIATSVCNMSKQELGKAVRIQKLSL